MTAQLTKFKSSIENAHGRVAAPILLYFLGVAGGVLIRLWLFFFRGR